MLEVERPLARSVAAQVPVKRLSSSFRHELRSKPALVAWMCFVGSLPFYFGPSGLPQPGNVFLLLIIPLTLTGWDGRLSTSVHRTLRSLAWFVVWVAIVNYGWVLVTGKFNLSDYAVVPLYYLFNALIVFLALVLARRYGELFLRATVYAVLFDVGFQVLASFFYRTELYRGELFFNNPNQLGYWALLAACLIALAQRRLGLGLVKASIGITGCAYLATLSASRAAVAGIAILLVLLLFANPRIIIVGVLAAIGLVNLGGPLANAIESSGLKAITDRERDVGFAEERGYTRLWEFKEYMLVGAGEGDLMRFVDDPLRANEIHSSAATIVFSYGIAGTLLFAVFFARLLRGATRRSILMLMPILAYTIAHQGLRFTLLWVLLAVFVALKAGPPVPVLRPILPSP